MTKFGQITLFIPNQFIGIKLKDGKYIVRGQFYNWAFKKIKKRDYSRKNYKNKYLFK